MIRRFLLCFVVASLGCTPSPSPTKTGPVSDTDAVMREVLDRYMAIQEKLAADTPEGVEDEAKALAGKISEFFMKPCKPEEAACASVMQKISAAAGRMKGTDLTTLRNDFKDLSVAMEKYWTDFSPAWPNVFVFHCPMADNEKGAPWLQKGSEIRNPYFGKTMSSCGEKVLP